MCRRLNASLCFSMLVACGAAPAGPSEGPDSTPPAKATRAPYADDLERAQQLAAEAEALEPPVAPRFADKAAALAFIKERVLPWTEERRNAVERADAAYGALTSQLPEGESAKVALAQGNLALSLAEDVLNVTVASAPPNIASDAEAMEAYRGAVLDAVEPQLKVARANFERCIATAGKIGSTDTVSACQARLALVPKPAAKPPSPPAPRPGSPTSSVLQSRHARANLVCSRGPCSCGAHP